ncbi:MAG: triose-phosphate isomerase [Dehalococcoidia bacterium]
MPERAPISVGNWKMHLSDGEADALCDGLAGIEDVDGVQVVLAPGYLQLARVRERFAGTLVGVAGQNMHFAEQGPHTGEVSPSQLAAVAAWAILGHSERRQHFCETDAALNKKVSAALEQGLQPILCVGEQEEERRNQRTEAVLARQVSGALNKIALPNGFVIAYEPIWAIGTGQAASGEQAQAAAAVIRGLVAELAGEATADTVRILYGGSVKPDNVAEFAAQPDVDGALVGGASLDAHAFMAITRVIAAAKSG